MYLSLNENKLNRAKFVQLALKDQKKAAEILRSKADGLEGCRTIGDVIYALGDILYCGERAIFRDLQK